MLQLGYTEADLPKDQLIINKYIFQNLVKNTIKKSPEQVIKKEKLIDKSKFEK